MDRRSKHLGSEERGVILAEHERGSSQRVIGRLPGRPASTICRELARGRQGDGSFDFVHKRRNTAAAGARAVLAQRTLLRAMSAGDGR